MAKKFNIHEWQAKHWLKNQLNEQDDFTPDLEDDELKRSKIQQMMAKEKDLANSEENIPELSDEEKDGITDMTNEFVRKLTDVRGGNYSGDKLLAALQFVILNIQDMEPMLYTDTDEDGIPDVVDNDEELEEQNTLAAAGSGASITTGDSEAFATPNAFGNNKNKKRQSYSDYEEIMELLTKKLYKEEEESEQEESGEEITQDVEKLRDHPLLDKVNTKEEWEDLLQVIINMADEIKTITPAFQKQILIQTIKDLNNPQ